MRLIDADALSNEILFRCNQEIVKYKTMRHALGNVGRVAFDCVKNAPAIDAVEVVRCKDCKHHYDSKFGYVVCIWFNKTVRADGYCNYGCKMDAEVEG